MDIREGDILVVGGKDYPVKSCAEWASRLGLTPAVRRMATASAGTKRLPPLVGGKRTEPLTHLIGLKCTPLDPVSAEIQKRIALDTPMELLQTFIHDGSGFIHLVVEDLKK